MLITAAILLLGAQDAPPVKLPEAAPAKKDTVAARVSGSFLHVALDIPGFTTDERNAKILARVFGERGVIVGAVPSKLTSIELLATKLGPEPKTDEGLRHENLDGSGARWEEFESAGFACCELSMMMDGSGSHDFHAFFVRGGYEFDLHVGETLTTERKAGFARDAFVKLIGSLRFGVVRRGTWEQMPPATLDVMNQAIQRGTGWRAWMKERAEAAQDDYATQFAAAEVFRHFGAPPGEQIPYYRRTIEILGGKGTKESPLSPQENLALAASEDGYAIALLDSNEPEKAIPHLERALEVARDLTAPIRAGVLYNLACAHARLGQEEIALARLMDSENSQPGAFVRARADKDFEKIRESKRFLEIINGDRANH